jgi:DNA-directed RNA polymerase subunit RPC12/RpoP
MGNNTICVKCGESLGFPADEKYAPHKCNACINYELCKCGNLEQVKEYYYKWYKKYVYKCSSCGRLYDVEELSDEDKNNYVHW